MTPRKGTIWRLPEGGEFVVLGEVRPYEYGNELMVRFRRVDVIGLEWVLSVGVWHTRFTQVTPG